MATGNKEELLIKRNGKGSLNHQVNEDENPEIIIKKLSQQLEYVQELAVLYLRPPTPPEPGEIVITQEANVIEKPAPPLILRQLPTRPETPEPLVDRKNKKSYLNFI
jgi:hypothetical protein